MCSAICSWDVLEGVLVVPTRRNLLAASHDLERSDDRDAPMCRGSLVAAVVVVLGYVGVN
jgi:hypothetical protein